jgi:hypothetical protein
MANFPTRRFSYLYDLCDGRIFKSVLETNMKTLERVLSVIAVIAVINFSIANCQSIEESIHLIDQVLITEKIPLTVNALLCWPERNLHLITIFLK